jgi:hypothetical protein
MQEVWKDIVGYEGCYQVSNLGNVKALRRAYYPNGATKYTEEKLIKFGFDKSGYYRVTLSKENKIKTYLVHRIVALHFIDNTENKLEVNHVDGDKQNNKADNLEWMTRSENMYHAFNTGLKISRKLGNHKMAKMVLDLQTGIFYNCAKEAALAKCINYSTLVNKLTKWHKNNYTDLIYI